jgi:class 3 adenylate cyclase
VTPFFIMVRQCFWPQFDGINIPFIAVPRVLLCGARTAGAENAADAILQSVWNAAEGHALLCTAEMAHDAKFCSRCGAPLQSISHPQSREHVSAGERRHLTVLFCDLVDSTQLAARLDPEEWQKTLAAYHRSAAKAIERFGGHVANYLGDGVMAYFGYPEAHENDAEPAARAGLTTIEAVAALNPHTSGPKLSARVGIDSGAVVVGRAPVLRPMSSGRRRTSRAAAGRCGTRHGGDFSRHLSADSWAVPA